MGKKLLKVILVTIGVVILILALGIPVAAGNKGGSHRKAGGSDEAGNQNKWGQTVPQSKGQSDDCTGTKPGGTGQTLDLSQEEKDWLTRMREEEKLARDVYFYFDGKYESRTFERIANSEQKHMDAIKVLLDRYGLDDPAEGKERGDFSSADFQVMYSDLTGQDNTLTEALGAGVDVEKMDIDDLTTALSLTTHKDIEKVYKHILQGSLNHLKVFNSELVKY